MTLRPFIAAFALLAAPSAMAAGDASAQPGVDTGTTATSTPSRTPQVQRKFDRVRPGTPLKPRVIEAPGAAVMMIPASFDSAMGPFSPL